MTTSTTRNMGHPYFSAVPFFMGYHPSKSIVFVSIRDHAAGVVMRMDYPVDCDPLRIEVIVKNLQNQGADSVAVVFYLPEEVRDSNELIDLIQSTMNEAELPIADFLVARKSRWKSIYCRDKECCSEKGHLLAKPSKNEFKGAVKAVEPIDYSSDNVQDLQRSGALAINDLLVDFRDKGEGASRTLAALVLSRLTDLTVRDYAIGVASDEIQKELFGMWCWLLTIAPKGYVAAPATLYAELAFERGEGALALKTLEKALEDNPDYQLAKLLRRTFAAGWLPENFKTMRSELHPKLCESLFGPSGKE